MDWTVLWEVLLSGHVGAERLQRVALLLSVSANLMALYGLWRWWTKPTTHAEAAAALRDQGEYRASLAHRLEAMALYDLAIRMNPGGAQTHFLRGSLLEEAGRINSAIAAWERCVAQHPRHAAAIEKLAQYGVTAPGVLPRRWSYAVRAGAAAVVCIALAGALAL